MDLRLPEPVVSGMAESSGARIAWAAFGEGPDAVLVVPTWNFVDSRVSARLVPDLARSFRVVTFDPRGAGQSDRPATGYRVADHVADALSVLDAAGIAGKASLIGASAGGEIAALFAELRPERVDRLILVDPAIEPDAAAPDATDEPDDFWAERTTWEGWEHWNGNLWRQDWPRFTAWFLRVAFNEPDSDELIEAIDRIALEAEPEILITQRTEQLAGADQRTVAVGLDAITVPTLIVHGERDLSVELPVGEAIARSIRGATLAVVRGGGHRPDIRSPELVNPLVIEFLQGRTPSARPGVDVR